MWSRQLVSYPSPFLDSKSQSCVSNSKTSAILKTDKSETTGSLGKSPPNKMLTLRVHSVRIAIKEIMLSHTKVASESGCDVWLLISRFCLTKLFFTIKAINQVSNTCGSNESHWLLTVSTLNFRYQNNFVFLNGRPIYIQLYHLSQSQINQMNLFDCHKHEPGCFN
jgi:hypothetical protein